MPHPGFYKGIKCSSMKKKTQFIPAPHQIIVKDYFLKSRYKGLFLYHKLGSGKSCTSIMVGDAMLKSRKIERVYVLTPGSLRKNWISEYCRVCGSLTKDMLKKFTFITYNYNVEPHLHRYDFDDSLVIIDEVHNLLNGYKNKSKNCTQLYEKIIHSNSRVLALSGTPIIQDDIAAEWSRIYKLLTGENVEYKDLKKIKDEDLKGIISYYPGDPSSYPEVRVQPVTKINMTVEQYEKYLDVCQKEARALNKGMPDPSLFYINRLEYEIQRREYMISVKRIVSRSVSNCFYGNVASCNDCEETDADDSNSDDSNDSEETDADDIELADRKLLPDLKKSNGGWVSTYALKNDFLKTMSPKFYAILSNIIIHYESKHVIYSFFKTRSGVQLLYALLTHCGITAEIYSGDVDVRKREEILDRFNSEENRRGKKLRVLLVTSAGGEGITILECNNIHIVESETKENKTRQAIGRIVRYKSHSKLPKAEQYVNVWRYWSVPPAGINKICVDESLYKRGILAEKDSNEFIERLIKNSIEQPE
jgi:superfamily II DNA or RNA helicase